MDIYHRIKFLREQINMTQEELAEKTGYKTRSAINKIEKGLRDINQSQIKAFADALNVTPAYLMGWEDSQGNNLVAESPAEYTLSEKESYLISKYRNLDDYGKETIDISLERELKRCEHSNIRLNAAHELPNASEEAKKRDNQMIEDFLRKKGKL